MVAHNCHIGQPVKIIALAVHWLLNRDRVDVRAIVVFRFPVFPFAGVAYILSS